MAKLKPLMHDVNKVPASPVLEARIQVRRRLIGAAILLSVGLFVFPFVFQTQPRPIAMDIPIVLPDAEPVTTAKTDPVALATGNASSPDKPQFSEPNQVAVPELVADTLPLELKQPQPSSTATVIKEPKFVVQAGAYTDARSVRELRRKIEAMGLKTYTQEVQIKGETKIRVRLGPFVNREEASKAQKKLKTLGLSPSLLTL